MDTKRNDPDAGWECPECRAHNGDHRRVCWYCGKVKQAQTSAMSGN